MKKNYRLTNNVKCNSKKSDYPYSEYKVRVLKIKKGFADSVYHLIFEGETDRIKAISFNQDTNSFYITVILSEEKKLLDTYEVGDEGLILEFHDEKE